MFLFSHIKASTLSKLLFHIGKLWLLKQYACNVKNPSCDIRSAIVFDSPSRDESLHQSYRNEQSDCWHWQGECFSGQSNQFFQLDYSLFLSLSQTLVQTQAYTENTEVESVLSDFVVPFLLIYAFALLQGHRPHVLDFDAVWSEGASPKDIYDSTTKAFIPLLSPMLLLIYYLALTVFTRSLKCIYLWFPVPDFLAVSDYTVWVVQPWEIEY